MKLVRGLIKTYSQMHEYREALTTQLKRLAILAKWLSVRLRT